MLQLTFYFYEKTVLKLQKLYFLLNNSNETQNSKIDEYIIIHIQKETLLMQDTAYVNEFSKVNCNKRNPIIEDIYPLSPQNTPAK